MKVWASVVMIRAGHLLVTRDFSNFELRISKSGKAVVLLVWFCVFFKGCIENLEYTSKICIRITGFQCGGTVNM